MLSAYVDLCIICEQIKVSTTMDSETISIKRSTSEAPLLDDNEKTNTIKRSMSEIPLSDDEKTISPKSQDIVPTQEFDNAILETVFATPEPIEQTSPCPKRKRLGRNVDFDFNLSPPPCPPFEPDSNADVKIDAENSKE